MASLPENASAEDVEDELIFQNTLLETMDIDAENFEEEKQQIEAAIQELEARLAMLNENQQAGSSLDRANPYLDVPSYGHRLTMNPKRRYNDIGSPEQEDVAFGKRSRVGTPLSTPGAATPGSSTESLVNPSQNSHPFGGLGYNRHRSAALQRQIQAEQEAARRASQAQFDEDFARALEESSAAHVQQPSQTSSQAVLNGDLTLRRPPSATLQSVYGRELTAFHDSTPILPASHQSPFADLLPVMDDFSQRPVEPPSPSTSAFSTPLQTRNPRGKIAPKTEPGLEDNTPIRTRPLLDGRHPDTAIPISSGIPASTHHNLSSADSDSDVVEIAAQDFTPRFRSAFGQRSRNTTVLDATPQAAPTSTSTYGLDRVYTPSVPGAWPSQAIAQPRYPWLGSAQGYNQYGSAGSSNLNTYGGYRPPTGDISDITSTLLGLLPGTQSNGIPGSRFPIDDLEHDSRFDYLYSDPRQSAEEIKKLVENIRPDEDLPAHLREGTPEALAVAMYPYQQLGLAWLKQQEEGSNKGGILADAMGLGKTIQAIALMVTHQSDDPACKTTLIIAPVALLKQWELEIRDRIKPRHRLGVYKHHGPTKRSYSYLRQFDVVLTTFGSLAAEFKKKEHWKRVVANNPNARPTKAEELCLIGDNCKWYRIIVDEAQCMKNKDTLTARAAYQLNAKYRLCMTGTPMMNNVAELFSLIHFLQIKPFNSWNLFRQEIQNPLKQDRFEGRRRTAMQKLQGIIRATMLRRTKESKLDGEPLLILPAREIERADVTFSSDEEQFYAALEAKVQLQFNRYLRAGTVMKNYANALVLLLRLRQACCHPHLTDRFDPHGAIEVDPEAMGQLAKELSEQVVERIRAADGNFMCPICYDTAENPAIFIPCGHDTCTECFSRLTDPSQAIAAGSEGGVEAKCPECRGKVDPRRVIDFKAFKQVHQPELLTQEEKSRQEDISTASDTDSASEDDEEDDSEDDTSSLNGFIVNDDDETESEEERKPKIKKKSRKSKRKGKAKASSGKKSLAQLKKEGMRNKAARHKYFKKLREEYITSSKIDQTLELLKEIHERQPVEKTLIFSQFTSLLDLLEIPIKDAKYDYRRYDGSMTPNERTEAALEFKQIPTCTVMLVSLKAGNAGLNLNCASQVIILDPFWNPFIEEQAIDRAHRIGQMRDVKVHRVLVPGTVEDRIIQMQEKKRELIGEALDENAGKQISRLGVQELAFLFGVSPNPGAN